MNLENKLLDVRHVSRMFQIGGFISGTKLMAVNDVNFSMEKEKPEIFTIAGESGSGKTTLSRMILRDLEPSNGEIFFEGRDVNTIRKQSEFAAFLGKVQPVFQNPFETFNPLRRVEDYLFDTAVNFGIARNRKSAEEIVNRALHLVGLSLEELSRRYAHELSGGQIQRISVARSLIPKPSLIIADEPVSMVDASLRMTIVNLFKKLRDEEKVSVIYITHDLATAYYISDRIAIMLRGYVVEMGPVEAVLGNPLHPYTKLLKESVPAPDPVDKSSWAQRIGLSTTEVKEYSRQGCKFAGRCPNVMDICKTADPPDFVADGTSAAEGRIVKCYLYSK